MNIKKLKKNCICVDYNVEQIGLYKVHHVYYKHKKTGKGYMLQHFGNEENGEIKKVVLYNHEY